MIDDVTGRISEGVNRARLELEARRAIRPLLVVLVGFAVTALGGSWLARHVSPTLLGGTQQVKFAVRDGYGVLPGVDKVRYRGIPSGTIKALDRREDGSLVLTAEFDDDRGPIYKDVKAALRPQTPLNDMYLDILDPGSKSAGEVGDTIVPEDRTETSVKVGDVLNALGANERTRLATLLDQLGNGMDDDGGDKLRAALVQLSPFLRSAAGITDQLADRRTATKRLVTNLATLTEELGLRDVALRRLVRDGSATFGTLQAGSADLDATLRGIPATFQELQSSFTAVRGVLGDVDGAVTALKPVAGDLPGALGAVRELQRELDPAVRQLGDPVRRLVPLAKVLAPMSADLSSALGALAPQVDSINKITDAVGGCLDPIRGFFQWNASLSKYGDARGPIPRGNLAIGVPDSGSAPSTRTPGKNCVPGTTIGGRVPRSGDEG